MPHLTIEYSANTASAEEFARVTQAGHAVMMQSGLFTAADIKTRTYPAHDFMVGEKGTAGRFVHVTVHLLEGRTMAQKQALSEALRDKLSELLPTVDQLSVDIRDMVKDCYRKHVRA